MNLSLAKNHTARSDFSNTLGVDCTCCLGVFLTTGVYFQTLPQQEGSEYVILCYFSNESWGSYVVILTPGAVFFKAHTKCQGTHNKISRIGKIAFAGFGEWAGCCWSHTLEGDTLTCSYQWTVHRGIMAVCPALTYSNKNRMHKIPRPLKLMEKLC